MAADYGQLKDVVAVAASIMAAGGAIGVAWIRRAKWMPPGEVVEGGTIKVAGLLSSVVIAILFLLRSAIGLQFMSVIAGIALFVTVCALSVSIYTNTRYSFLRRQSARKGAAASETRILGGSKLTDEAKEIGRKKGMGEQQIFENSNYNVDLVWTKSSQALVQIASTIGFILLQFSGSVALASVAIAFSLTN